MGSDVSDKILYQNEYLAIIERKGYFFSREIRCNGIIVTLLPFRINKGTGMEFLARLEVCPAHGEDLTLYSITGGLEKGKTIKETAQQELHEEAGFQVELDEFIDLGHVRPSKAADTTVYLFAVDVASKLQSAPQGDGSKFEANASVKWVNYKQGIQIEDPLFVTALTRLRNLLKEENNGVTRQHQS